MSDYSHHPKDMIPYSEKLPLCPKCGSDLVKRIYRQGKQEYETPYYWGEWDGKEYLDVVCQSCGYSFPQHVKETDLEYKNKEKK